MGLLNQGDEVLIPGPGFAAYGHGALLDGGVLVRVRLFEENDFKPSLYYVTSLVTDKSRVMILALSKIAVERDLTVISDEVYERIVCDGVKHYCLAAFPRMRERYPSR
jgi:aspartate/methionine/tyrosine aminotransferase